MIVPGNGERAGVAEDERGGGGGGLRVRGGVVARLRARQQLRQRLPLLRRHAHVHQGLPAVLQQHQPAAARGRAQGLHLPDLQVSL